VGTSTRPAHPRTRSSPPSATRNRATTLPAPSSRTQSGTPTRHQQPTGPTGNSSGSAAPGDHRQDAPEPPTPRSATPQSRKGCPCRRTTSRPSAATSLTPTTTSYAQPTAATNAPAAAPPDDHRPRRNETQKHAVTVAQRCTRHCRHEHPSQPGSPTRASSSNSENCPAPRTTGADVPAVTNASVSAGAPKPDARGPRVIPGQRHRRRPPPPGRRCGHQRSYPASDRSRLLQRSRRVSHP
jgi:hypothetical protein